MKKNSPDISESLGKNVLLNTWHETVLSALLNEDLDDVAKFDPARKIRLKSFTGWLCNVNGPDEFKVMLTSVDFGDDADEGGVFHRSLGVELEYEGGAQSYTCPLYVRAEPVCGWDYFEWLTYLLCFCEAHEGDPDRSKYMHIGRGLCDHVAKTLQRGDKAALEEARLNRGVVVQAARYFGRDALVEPLIPGDPESVPVHTLEELAEMTGYDVQEVKRWVDPKGPLYRAYAARDEISKVFLVAKGFIDAKKAKSSRKRKREHRQECTPVSPGTGPATLKKNVLALSTPALGSLEHTQMHPPKVIGRAAK